MQHPYLLNAELGVPVGDGLAELVRERVQHRVVRVNGGQAVLLELEKWIGQFRSIVNVPSSKYSNKVNFSVLPRYVTERNN